MGLCCARLMRIFTIFNAECAISVGNILFLIHLRSFVLLLIKRIPIPQIAKRIVSHTSNRQHVALGLLKTVFEHIKRATNLENVAYSNV